MEPFPREQRQHWLDRPGRPLEHEALLTLARKVCAAASDADPWYMERAARHLADALDRHIRSETRSLGHLTPAEARILRKGQERIYTLAGDLVSDAGLRCRRSGDGCEARSQELLALLTLQARDERHAWGSRKAA